MIEELMSSQFQMHLDEADLINPFQLDFILEYSTETVLVTSVNDLYWKLHQMEKEFNPTNCPEYCEINGK